MQFRARLAAVRGTWGTTGVKTTVQVQIETEGVPGDWLMAQLGQELLVDLDRAPPEKLPLEEAIDATYADPVAVPSAGRRRNGTRSSERV